jgi:hypothetical protein
MQVRENWSVCREDVYFLYVQDGRRSLDVVAAHTLFIYSSFEARSVYQQSLAPRHHFQFGFSPLEPLLVRVTGRTSSSVALASRNHSLEYSLNCKRVRVGVFTQ